jgi:undecaprenyl diphosphate synthase
MDKLPNCLGFIMDGNRRFAKEAGLPTLEGHRRGGQVLIDSMRYFSKAKIPHLVYFAFSTENWNRSEDEVSYLMKLFGEYLEEIKKEIKSKAKEDAPFKIRFIGRREDFDTEMQFKMNELELIGEAYDKDSTTVWIALSYGGRAEIIEAVNVAIGGGRAVTEALFEKLLWTAELPEADMIVRTGGEMRLSNFLTWRSVYSELYFIEKHWPSLTEVDFKDILNEYAKRERRHGR